MYTDTERHLIYDYDSYLIGNLPRKAYDPESDFDDYYFKGKIPATQTKLAFLLIRHLIEDILKWTPEMARDCLTPELLETWHLGSLLNMIVFPKELDKRYDLYYIASQIWPERIKIEPEQIYIGLYKRIIEPINGSLAKYPKEYFSDSEGICKACVCFRYAIEHKIQFSSVEDMYMYFGDVRKCSAFMRQYKLMLPSNMFFSTYVQYLHTSLPKHQRKEMLYFHYDLWQKAQIVKRKNKKIGEYEESYS